MDNSNILSTVSLVISVAGGVLVAVNHKRLRSTCCRREMVMSFDIENTTPPQRSPTTPAPTPPPVLKVVTV